MNQFKRVNWLLKVLLANGILFSVLFNRFGIPAVSAAPGAGYTFTVNTTLDTPSPDASTGICVDANGKCSLRAAIMVTNFFQGADTIILPAGTYTLTRAGYDDGALVGDLDISDALTIQGAGSGVTIVDGNGTVTGDRVFQVLSTAMNVTFSGLTIRNGQSLTNPGGPVGGGGIYMDGAGLLSLSDVILENNSSTNGGGLYAKFTALGGGLSISHTIVRSNTVNYGGQGEGGGIYANLPSTFNQMVVQNSQIYSNTAGGIGGGFFVSGTNLAKWSIRSSELYANNAAAGGGIGNSMPLTLTDSNLHDNHVSYDGGGMQTFSPVTIRRTTFNANSAGRFGGGIFSLADGSTAIYNDFLNISESTLSYNSAKDGGGIYHDGFINYASILTLTNSTVSGNIVSEYGGGLSVFNGQAQLFNVTIANNRVHPPLNSGTSNGGGGLYASSPAVLTIENTIIAHNTRAYSILNIIPDDCSTTAGVTGQLGFSLITDFTNCFITGAQVGNIIGQDPLLGPLAYNGGSTQTIKLANGSPAIDAGATLGCTGATGAPITTDERALPRPEGANCDIGAFEFDPHGSTTFLPFVH